MEESIGSTEVVQRRFQGGQRNTSPLTIKKGLSNSTYINRPRLNRFQATIYPLVLGNQHKGLYPADQVSVQRDLNIQIRLIYIQPIVPERPPILRI